MVHDELLLFVVVSHIQRIGCQPEKVRMVTDATSMMKYLIAAIALCMSRIMHGFVTVPRISPSGAFSLRNAADGKLGCTPQVSCAMVRLLR